MSGDAALAQMPADLMAGLMGAEPWLWAEQGLAPLLRQQAPHAPALAQIPALLLVAPIARRWQRRNWQQQVACVR